ncbi:MAG: hypothetical protein A3H98_14115 [Bacteroidetes bacterium RIFCSPLOWO2_02_FULL_36_8]|nr:MAG: hypothetical protein A3H98_14115 [Bacteroidetes bacterium RIFCSPLOWO2_02_FULL_36_8]
MLIDPKTSHILCLNIHKKDPERHNDAADVIARLQIKNFAGGEIFYVTESIVENGEKKTEARIRQIIKEKMISVVFFAPNGDNYEMTPEFLRCLKAELKVKIVLWILDDELIFDTYSKYYAQVVDAVVTTDYYATFAYQRLGIPALHFLSNFSQKDYYPVDVRRDIDVSYVGDCTKADRREFLNYLKGNGVNVLAFGNGSEHGFVKKEDISVVFSRSKVNLNFTKCNKPTVDVWYLEDNNLVNLINQQKGNPFEIALTKSFCLSEYWPSLGCAFEIGTDLDVFYDKDDLLKKVRYYLKNEELRNKIANNAYEKTITVHDTDISMPRLMNELCNILNNSILRRQDKVIYKDVLFKKNHITKLTILMFFQVSKLKLMPAFETFSDFFQYGFIIFMGSAFRGVKISVLKFIAKLQKRQKLLLNKTFNESSQIDRR